MKTPPKKNATIRDVAKAAGLSIKTVSRVLNNEPKVSHETLARVQAATKALAYVPNPAARDLSRSVNRAIGLALPLAISHPERGGLTYAIGLQLGALTACRRMELGMLLLPRERADMSEADDIVRRLTAARVQGVVVADPDDALLGRLTESGITFSSISANHTEVETPVVIVNDQSAAAAMTRLLIGRGHRRIGFVQGMQRTRAAQERLKGYHQAMKEAGIAVNPAWLKQGDFSFQSGRVAGAALLTQSDRVTAIFAANDDMAIGVIHAAHELGLNIPQQVSIVGFDDTESAHLVWPALTTMRQPLSLMAEAAVDQVAAKLFPALKDIVERPRKMLFECELMLRGSVGPALA